MKYLKILFPLSDHLYIFQILEYNPVAFINWFLRYPFKRNLQKKHQLTATPKASLLFIISLLLMTKAAIISNLLFLRGFDLPVVIFLIIYFQLFSPIFLLFSQLILWPYEQYSKRKIIKAAQKKLAQCKGLRIVAITGSFAKTSTKNMLYTLLWKKYRVVKTPKSYNNPLSIAQTILKDVKDNTEILIVEVGAYKKGEIRKVTGWLKPDMGIITGIAPQHLERFGSLKNIAHAKFELVEGLAKNSIAVVNGESEMLIKLAKKTKCKVIFYGTQKNLYYASGIKVALPGTSFILHTTQNLLPINIPLIGEHHVQNFLAAAAAASSLGMSLKEIGERADKFLPTPHRLEIKNEGSMTIIDNSYNTNPDSAKISFKLLKEYPGGQKIIITPGLIELGSESSTKNQEFAKDAAKIANEIIIVGETNKKDLLAGLKNAKFLKGKTHTAKDLQDGMDLLRKIAKESAVVLIENDLPDQYF